MTEFGRGCRAALALLAAGTFLSSADAAVAQQALYPPGAVVQPLPANSGAGAELRRHLSDLADNPRSLTALIGAGRAALTLGDAQAALTFFGRAEEAAPRDARVKAGMAAALVHMEQPEHALRMFAEAVTYGAPEVEIAKDRGLAYDMVGDPRRAQQDYALVLRRGDDVEVRQRLALSLAISGESAAALRLIDADLRRNDRGAWRTRAFIHALTGDAAEAASVAHATMPAPQVQAMAPFLARLAVLSPAQKARAVHFGHFPSDGQPVRAAAVDTRAYPGALAMAGVPRTEQVQTAAAQSAGRTAAAAPAPAPRRRATETRTPRRPSALAPAEPRPTRAAPSPAPAPAPAPVQYAQATPPPPPPPAPPPPAPAPVQQAFALQQVAPAPTPAPPAPAPSAVETVALPPAAAPTFAPAPAPAPPPAPAPASRPGFEEVAALVSALPAADPVPTPRPAPPPPPPSPAPQAAPAPQAERPAPRRAATRPQPARPAHPSRHWVQVAGGADKSTLPREWTRLKAKAPALLGSRTAWTTPLRATNRLLVGPFDSSREAQEFVNQLARSDISAFSWTSPEGQEIERLPSR